MRKFWRYFGGLCALLALWGCDSLPLPTPSPTPAPTQLPIQRLACTEFARYDNLACLDSTNAVLLQVASNTSASLTLASIDITLDDTLFIRQDDRFLSFTLIAGRGVIGSQGATRILQIEGTQVTVELASDTFRAISTPSAIDNAGANVLNTIPSHRLPRPVSVPRPIITPRAEPTLNIGTDTDCAPLPSWNQFYTVQRGDSLYAIAQTNEVSLEELITGNCLGSNLNIFPGDLLRIPDENATTELSSIRFATTQNEINTGNCTTLSWQAEGVSLVYFQGEAVAQEATREVCPEITTTYALLVIFNNGAQEGFTQTITVNP